jgi:hypothetical protein
MPRVLVLFAGAESPSATLAEFAADAAKSMRFTEVDIRAAAPHQATTGVRHTTLDASAAVQDYDGVIIVGAAGETPAALGARLDEWDKTRPGAFANTVFALISYENTDLLERVARLGGILVTAPRGATDPEIRARQTGERTARVVGWVRHSLSHEHAHEHHAH